MNDEQKKHFLAGFDLAAQRRSDGKLHGYLGDSVIDEWPQEIEMCGNVYTLENVLKMGDEGYESGQYA